MSNNKHNTLNHNREQNTISEKKTNEGAGNILERVGRICTNWEGKEEAAMCL
ncbi:Uncharacterized protein APZ42_004978 [Daphnia magna]|uniref:Uncharacterized protein n=1 Tax=Daphnia magna TaxID=35525 RepID=A0A164GQN6_9CRUS|nr:Uncharacterized protein APZ42_004978 [Daphnia magna]